MAALVAPNNPTIHTAAPNPAGVNKRYRPAPAKTFQCRGYGECRMVFSRSEHLARHIRKHTGERPFTCHCSKQFSRLDNLRQHAQTVHADKQEQNERMMRELTSLHASMAAANKSGQTRGKRGHASLNAAAVIAASNDNGMHSLDQVKEEDVSSVVPPMHHRPGTSTGYEGGDNMIYGNGWATDVDRGDPRPPNNHSFRDSTRSFRVPPASATSSFYSQQQSQSFLPFSSHTFNFSLSSRDGRPGSSSSRPPTAGSSDSHARTLPPLAAVVSATIPPPPPQSFPIPPQSTQHILPLPGSLAFNRRPNTANRPGTAPASYYSSKPAYDGGPGLAHQPELSLPAYGRSSELAAAAAATAAAYHSASYDPEPSSPSAYDSPFSFHPPALAESTSGGSFASSPSNNPRKRPFSGVDNSPDEGPRREQSSNGLSGPGEYDYGSESRPQSRRLSVLELCNDSDADAGVRTFLSATTGSTSRPTTSSGLVSSASALALTDRSPVSGYPLLAGAQPAAAPAAPPTTAAATATAPSGTAQSFGGGRISPAFRRDAPSPPTPGSTANHVLSAHRGAFSSSPLSDTSRSPRLQPTSAAFAAVARSVHVHSHPSSPSTSSSHTATPPALSRRGESQQQQHEVRSSPVASAYSSAAVGMKV
ncbi:hypothetical protein F5I97DRAFT_1801613 [Phlebopus sp. FC_14]|nr:hypothetical protein F5I97DRAFT_1801613 [Phlebopus sp. FC_14]